jgi:LysM repeat protein
MLTRNLFIIGIVLLALALALAIAGSIRPSPPMMAVRATAQNLAPPTQTPTQTPTKALTPTPTNTLRPPTSTPTSSPTLTSTPERQTITYVVRPGDTLFSIARRYGVTVQAIVEANDINPNAIYAGQTLKIVAQTSGPTPGPTTPPAISSPTPTITPSPTVTRSSPPTVTEQPQPTPTPGPTVAVEAEWPQKMQLERSDSIRIALVNQSGTLIPTVEVPGHTAVADTPFPFGTPGVPIGGAFGPDYDAFVIARLAGTAFDIQAATSEQYQWFEQSRVTWEWNIIPKIPGAQVINANIEIQWKRRDTGQTIVQPIWRSRLEVVVEKPWLTTGQISLFTMISGVLGSGLSVPWVYERIQEWRKGRGKKAKAHKKK